MDSKTDLESTNTQHSPTTKKVDDLHFDNNMGIAEQIKAVIYGQCIGDAIGLLTEFMSEDEAKWHYGKYKDLEYKQKYDDHHRRNWEEGDWTDDSDQMILLLDSLIEDKGRIRPQTFATKLKRWARVGFQELGDDGGCGIGQLTAEVIKHAEFENDPEKISHQVWIESHRHSAPNGGVMRTSIMGVHQFWNIEQVMENAVKMCTVTHFDQRCKASVVAVSTAISLMLERKYYDGTNFNVLDIINESYKLACMHLHANEEKIELKNYMYCDDIAKLKLAEDDTFGYTFKCVGAGFWSLKQDNFRQALQAVAMHAGDADTNGAVAGALLGCKLGLQSLPVTWLDGLRHKTWLDKKIESYLKVLDQLYIDEHRRPVSRTISDKKNV